MIRKTMLLATSACALAAFVFPAAAQASPDWEPEKAITDGKGQLHWVSGSGLSVGPTNITFSGESTAATEGLITHFVIDVPVGGIPTSAPSCFVIAATNSTTGGGEGREEEWPITLGTSGAATHMTVSNVTYTTHFAGAGCVPASIPAKLSVTGAMTLVVLGGEGNAATANGANDPLTLEGNGVHFVPAFPVNFNSSINLTWQGPPITP